jgi:hypothetical protein
VIRLADAGAVERRLSGERVRRMFEARLDARDEAA